VSEQNHSGLRAVFILVTDWWRLQRARPIRYNVTLDGGMLNCMGRLTTIDMVPYRLKANIEDTLSIDTKYLFSLFQPSYPWGTQKPHEYVFHNSGRLLTDAFGRSSRSGVFVLADTIQRQFPTSFDPITHERIHPSVLMQSAILPQLANTLATHPDLVAQLMPLEQQAKQQWPSTSSEHARSDPMPVGVKEVEVANQRRRSFITRTVGSLRRRGRRDGQITQAQFTGVLVEHADPAASVTAGDRGWLLRLMHESSLGVFIRDLV